MRRLPQGQKADKDLLLKMKGVPWEPRRESRAGRSKRADPLVPLPVAQAGPQEEVTNPADEQQKEVDKQLLEDLFVDSADKDQQTATGMDTSGSAFAEAA